MADGQTHQVPFYRYLYEFIRPQVSTDDAISSPAPPMNCILPSKKQTLEAVLFVYVWYWYYKAKGRIDVAISW